MTSQKAVSVYEAKRIIIDVGLKCWQKGWVAANDGNISYKISDDRIVCTPTGVSKGMLTPEMLCVVDPDGNVIQAGDLKPSSEIKMHLRVMRERPDVKSVFHAHPPHATAHAIAGIPLAECVIPEIILGLGSIPIAPYGTPSTNEIPDRLAPLLKNYDAWLLENHGALTAGKDPYQSYFRMESLELYAQMMCIAKGLGKVNTLNNSNIQALIGLRKKFGIEEKDNILCTQCGACGKPTGSNSGQCCVPAKPETRATAQAIRPETEPSRNELIDTIVQRVQEALKQTR